MLNNFDDLLGQIIPKKDSESPTNFNFILYFFLEKGIGFDEFMNLPIPYILNMLDTHKFVIKEQEKELKKGSKK